MTPLDDFLAAGDLDEVAALGERIAPLTPPDQERVAELALRGSGQGRDNLLMHPGLLPPAVRLEALLRGLGEGATSYAALAAAVGLADLGPDDVPGPRRTEVVALLLDLVGADAGVLAARAAMALHLLLPPAEVVEVVPLLAHPSLAVRRALLAAVVSSVGAAGLQSLLGSPGFVDPDAADAVLRRLQDDGVHLDQDLAPPLPLLLRLPDREEWHG